MTSPYEIVVYCEGTSGGADVRLLEQARAALEADGWTDAGRLTLIPAGAWFNLAPVVRAARGAQQGAGRCFAVRDRDFMRRADLELDRAQALDEQASDPKAWPLSRHSIESYLLEPAWLGNAIEAQELAERIDRLAAARRFLDAVRAALSVVTQAVRTRRVSIGLAPVPDEPTARRVLADRLRALRTDIKAELLIPGARSHLGAILRDFEADGELRTRVDGKRLLRTLEAGLRDDGILPGGGLKARLVKHAEEAKPPEPLVQDLRLLVSRIFGGAPPEA